MKFNWFGEPHISLGFAEIDYEHIACLIEKTDKARIVSIVAVTVDPERLAILQDNESLSIEQDGHGYFYNVEAHKKSSDADLLQTLSLLSGLEPEELIITVSEESGSDSCFWHMVIIYYENVVDIYYDSSMKKRDAIKFFEPCFK